MLWFFKESHPFILFLLVFSFFLTFSLIKHSHSKVYFIDMSFWFIFLYLFIRVFLRAINTYADTMKEKFLNNDDFEVQVTVFLCAIFPSFVSYWCHPSYCVWIPFNAIFLCIPSLPHSSSLSSCGITTSTWQLRLLPRSPCSFNISHQPRGTRFWPSERRAI